MWVRPPPGPQGETSMKWFTWQWYAYLFKDCTGLRNFICRAKGHPYGVWYYNPDGLEPDMRCRNCGENLG